MESKSDDKLSNSGDTPKKDQTLIPTPDQDQKGNGKGKKPEAYANVNADNTIYLLHDEIAVLQTKKQELQLRLDDFRKQLALAKTYNLSPWAEVEELEKMVESMGERKEKLQQQVFKALKETMTTLAGFRPRRA